MSGPRRLLAAISVFLTIAALPRLGAQVVSGLRSNSSGLLVSVSANGMSITTDNDDGTESIESGAGFGAALGWGFSPQWSGILGLRGAQIALEDGSGDYTVAQIDLGARYTFRHDEHVARPYIDLLLSGRGLSTEITDGFSSADLEASGGGATFDIGSQFFFSRTIALDVALGYTFGKFGDPKINGRLIPEAGEIDANGGHFRIGLSFRPTSARR